MSHNGENEFPRLKRCASCWVYQNFKGIDLYNSVKKEVNKKKFYEKIKYLILAVNLFGSLKLTSNNKTFSLLLSRCNTNGGFSEFATFVCGRQLLCRPKSQCVTRIVTTQHRKPLSLLYKVSGAIFKHLPTSSGSDQTKSQRAPLCGISWSRFIARIWSEIIILRQWKNGAIWFKS